MLVHRRRRNGDLDIDDHASPLSEVVAVGQEFKTTDEAYKFIESEALQRGFYVTKSLSRIYFYVYCQCAGSSGKNRKLAKQAKVEGIDSQHPGVFPANGPKEVIIVIPPVPL